MSLRWLWPWAALMGCTVSAAGQDRALSLEQALALARERGASVALAEGRIGEAQAALTQAGRRFQENPVLEAAAGPRLAGHAALDGEAAVSQGLTSGRWRSARVAGAQASLERATADLEEARRLLQREVWTAFVRALAQRERASLLEHSRDSADQLLAATERRYQSGEATALALDRARTVAAGARAEQSAAAAEESTALAEVQALLALPPSEALRLDGSLAPPPPPPLGTLLAGLDKRPDLQALAAELREADAEIRLGQSLAHPDWGLRGAYSREDDADIVTAGVAVSLPVHNRGQETLATGQARTAALRRALAAARSAAEAEVRGQYAALTLHLAAVRELEQTALPALEDSEALARQSFEAGEINLGDLLQVRREILETRLAYLDRLLAASLARCALQAAAGGLP